MAGKRRRLEGWQSSSGREEERAKGGMREWAVGGGEWARVRSDEQSRDMQTPNSGSLITVRFLDEIVR